MAQPTSPIDQASPPWYDRLTAVACYFGLAPVLRLARRRGDSFFDHHATTAALLWLLLDGLIIAFLVWLAVISMVMIYAREVHERLQNAAQSATLPWDAIPVLVAVVIWLGSVLAGAMLAASGSLRPLPLVGRLARRPRCVRAAWLGNTLSLLLACFVAAAAAHASTFTRDDGRPAELYVLYDDMGVIPRWVMNLGFYRLSRAAEDRWGPQNVVLGRLDEPHLRSALEHGRVVFLACHGAEGEIVGNDWSVKPAAAVASTNGDQAARGVYTLTRRGGERFRTWIEPGPNLRLVYNAACDSGRLGDAWSRSLAPAEVKTFDRLSLVVEHLWWALFAGPRLVRQQTRDGKAPSPEVDLAR